MKAISSTPKTVNTQMACMDDLILYKLKHFLESERWGFGTIDIQRNTRIEQDLKLTGDDAVEFVITFGKEFGVDVSDFMANDYFKPEGICIFDTLFRKDGKKALTIGDLENAILLKKLR